MPLAPLFLSHLAYEVNAAGYWFRLEGDRLFITARRPGVAPLPSDLAERVRAHKTGIIAAMRTIPPGCCEPLGHFYAGRCTREIWQYLEVAP
jgi:hypothetical protein